jgi:hypothetical protein
MCSRRASGIADQLERWRRRQLRFWPHRGAGADQSCRPPQRGCELGDVGGRVGFPAAVTAVAVTASRTCSSATTAGHQAVIRPLTRCGSARARWTAEDRAQIRPRPHDVVRIAHVVLAFVHRLLEVHPSCLRGSSPDTRVGIRRLEDPRDDPLVPVARPVEGSGRAGRLKAEPPGRKARGRRRVAGASDALVRSDLPDPSPNHMSPPGSSAPAARDLLLGRGGANVLYRDAKRPAISAQSYRRLAVCARRPRARRSWWPLAAARTASTSASSSSGGMSQRVLPSATIAAGPCARRRSPAGRRPSPRRARARTPRPRRAGRARRPR